MVADMLGAWSAALAVLFLGAGGYTFLRLYDIWRATDMRRRILICGAAWCCMGWGWHQSLSAWAWITDRWSPGPLIVHGFGYRMLMSVGILMLAGAMSRERCGHKGWTGLLAVASLIAGAAFYMQD